MTQLRDGSSVTIRPATAQDEPALRSFLAGLCLEAQRLRFFTAAANIDYAAHLAVATGADRYGLIAVDQAASLVGHAIYIQLDQARAEVAVEVADRFCGRGLGTILIERLAAVAESHGITHFTAEVLPENHAMLDVFRNGFDAKIAFRHGTDAVDFPTAGARGSRAEGMRQMQALDAPACGHRQL
jgi:GNAT superfamily N-acetyltransferase